MNRVTASAMVGALGVACSAFGAHALRGAVTDARLATWQTAAHQHLLHAVLLMVLALAAPDRKLSWNLIFAGVVVFGGSLYTLVLTDIGALGAITPIGGVLLILGWLSLARRG